MWGTNPWLKESQKHSQIDKGIRNKGHYSCEDVNPEDYEKIDTFGIKIRVL